jgi:hypothetical protein
MATVMTAVVSGDRDAGREASSDVSRDAERRACEVLIPGTCAEPRFLSGYGLVFRLARVRL